MLDKADVGLHGHLERVQREEAGHTLCAHLLAHSRNEWDDEVLQLQRTGSEDHVLEDSFAKFRREIEKSEWRAFVLDFPGACLRVYAFACEASCE